MVADAGHYIPLFPYAQKERPRPRELSGAFHKRLATPGRLGYRVSDGRTWMSEPINERSEMVDTASSQEKQAPFRIGQLVRRRAGGPLMTVHAVEGGWVECIWFCGDRLFSEGWPASELRHGGALR